MLLPLVTGKNCHGHSEFKPGENSLFGEDANWGRIVMAMGQTDVLLTPGKLMFILVICK